MISILYVYTRCAHTNSSRNVQQTHKLIDWSFCNVTLEPFTSFPFSHPRSLFPSLSLALAQRFDIFDMNSFCFILYFLTTCSSDSSFFGDFGSIRSVCVWVSAFVIFCPCAYNNKFSLVFSSCFSVCLCFVIWAELSFKKQIQATTTTTIPHHSTALHTKQNARGSAYTPVCIFSLHFLIFAY